jgi:hypothetical protein
MSTASAFRPAGPRRRDERANRDVQPRKPVHAAERDEPGQRRRGWKAIEDHALANGIVSKDTYTAADKAKLIALSKTYQWHSLNPPRNALVQLQKVRGQLFRQPEGKPLEVVANGRADWTGWFELRREDVS